MRSPSALKAVTIWTVDEFKTAVKAAPGKLKLALLLMANCGMTQKGVADLRAAIVAIVLSREYDHPLESRPNPGGAFIRQ